MPTIVVITTGGTIASTATETGKTPSVSGDDLLRGVAPPKGYTVRVEDVMSIDSSAMGLPEMDQVRQAVTQACADTDVAGIVVSHGTDTMEETAMLVDLMHSDPRPVVFTGAQRSSDDDEPDGEQNLTNALLCAADPANRHAGVLIRFGRHLLPARGTRKVRSTDLDAFWCHDPIPTPRLVVPPADVAGHSVPIIYLYPGISDFSDCGADGVVLIATGSGNTNPHIVEKVASMTIPVVVTSRIDAGAILATYGGGGGAKDLQRSGAIISTWLRAPQARMQLLALLANDARMSDIAASFN